MSAFDHTSGKYYNIEGADIYYEIKGSKTGPVILLLHGGCGSMEDFGPMMPMLDKKYCIIGVDSRGHGKSTMGNKKLTYERLQKDVEGVLRYLDIKKLTIVGLSDGGITAYRLAVFSSLHIERLITMGARWHMNDAILIKGVLLKITPESWREKFPEMYTAYQKLNPEPNFNELMQALLAMWLDEGESGYPNEQLKQLACSLLIVRGDKDNLLSRKSAAGLADLLKNAVLLNIPFAGHVAFVDQPEIFKISLQQFLD